MKSQFPTRLLTFLFLLAAVLATLTVYTFLHEGGHALAGLAFGGRVTDFSIDFFDLSAHAGLDGDFSRAQNAVINVSGVSLPLLAWLLAILFLPRRGGPLFLWGKIVFSMGTLNTLLAWVIVPVLALNGKAPPGDDVTRFLSNTGWHPLTVAAAAGALYVGGWVLFLRRAGDLRQALVPLGVAPGSVIPKRRLVLAGLTLLFFLALAVLLVVFVLPNPSGPSRGYVRVAQVDLASQEYEDEVIYRFDAQPGRLAGVYVDFADLEVSYLDLTLAGADDQTFVLLHGEDFSAAAGSVQGSYGLAAGEARLLLTSQAAGGVLTIYLQESP